LSAPAVGLNRVVWSRLTHLSVEVCMYVCMLWMYVLYVMQQRKPPHPNPPRRYLPSCSLAQHVLESKQPAHTARIFSGWQPAVRAVRAGDSFVVVNCCCTALVRHVASRQGGTRAAVPEPEGKKKLLERSRAYAHVLAVWQFPCRWLCVILVGSTA
jgi:hypothetical protein